jgi:hypothetical protein
MSLSRTVSLFGLSLLGLVFFAWHLRTAQIGVDWHNSFYPFTVTWWQGQAVYAPPYYGVFNPPWLALLLTPMMWMGEKGGQAALALLTVAGTFGAWRLFSRGYSGMVLPVSLAIALCNLHMFDLLYRGQLDVFVLIGIMFLYVALLRKNALWFAVGVLLQMRPTGNVLLLLYAAWVAYRDGYLWRALALVIGGGVASLVVFGPDWPLRYYQTIRFDAPPQPGPWLVTLWTTARYLGIPEIWANVAAALVVTTTGFVIWRYRPSLRVVFALLPAASLLIVPYALSYHYLVMLVTAPILLMHWHRWLAVPIYLLTLTALLRLTYGLEIAWVDISLPLFIWSLLIVNIVRESREAVEPEVSALVQA